MKYTILSFFFILICSSFFCVCGSKTTEIIYNNGVPGTIIAQVQLCDSLSGPTGQIYLPDASGIEVSIEGTSFKTVTDKNGKCTLSNIPPGVYSIFFKKDGFTTQKDAYKEFAGNGTDVVYSELFLTTHKTAELVIREFDSNGIAFFSWKVFDSLKSYDAVVGSLFLSDKPEISPYDTSSYRYVITDFYYASTTPTDRNIPISKTDLLSSGFSDKEKIYCLLCTSNVSGYYDILSGKTIFYNGLSPYNSGEKSFVLR
jgi:hypothetical protein